MKYHLIFMKENCLLLQERAEAERQRWQRSLRGLSGRIVENCFIGAKSLILRAKERKGKRQAESEWFSRIRILL